LPHHSRDAGDGAGAKTDRLEKQQPSRSIGEVLKRLDRPVASSSLTNVSPRDPFDNNMAISGNIVCPGWSGFEERRLATAFRLRS
jgi:hypothetical protein